MAGWPRSYEGGHGGRDTPGAGPGRHAESAEKSTGDTTEVFQEKPPSSEVEEIEAERERRLAPENRPENAEIDNSDEELPTVQEFEELNADDDQEGSAGTADPARSSAR